MVGGMTTTLTSQDQEGSVQQDQAYVVTGIEFEYAKSIPGLPDPQSIFDLEINLSRVIDGWVGPDKQGEPTTIALGLIGSEGPVTLYPSSGMRSACSRHSTARCTHRCWTEREAADTARGGSAGAQ